MKNMKWLLLLLLFQVGCQEGDVERWLNMISAKLDGWSQSNPLTIYVFPFRPADEFDEESFIGKIMWQGAIDGVEYSQRVTGQRVRLTSHEGKSSTRYDKLLKDESLYDNLSASSEKRLTLKVECEKRNSESIMYGLYDGGDIEIQQTMYLYVKRENIIVKDRTTVGSNKETIIGLRDNLKKGNPLTPSQNQLYDMINKKSMDLTEKLIIKYSNGAN